MFKEYYMKFKTKEELNAMALETQKFMLEHFQNVDWSTLGIKTLFNYTKSLMITIKRGRVALKRNPELQTNSEWPLVIEASLEILHSCILQINSYLESGETASIDTPLSLTLMADFIKLCNDEEDVRDSKDYKNYTTLDGEVIENKLEEYLNE